MNCREFKEQVQAFVLHALEPLEEQACIDHLSQAIVHEGCEEALAEGVDIVGELAGVLTPETPGPKVWERIESGLKGSEAGPALLRPRRRARWAPWAMAAAAVLALGVVWWDRTSLTSQLDAARDRRAAVTLLAEPGTQLFVLSPPSGASSPSLQARALYHPGSHAAFLVFRGSPAGEGQDYELWVIRGKDKLPAGLLRVERGGEGVARIDPELFQGGKPDALAVTLEPKGGGAAPRGPILLVGTPPAA